MPLGRHAMSRVPFSVAKAHAIPYVGIASVPASVLCRCVRTDFGET